MNSRYLWQLVEVDSVEPGDVLLDLGISENDGPVRTSFEPTYLLIARVPVVRGPSERYKMMTNLVKGYDIYAYRIDDPQEDVPDDDRPEERHVGRFSLGTPVLRLAWVRS